MKRCCHGPLAAEPRRSIQFLAWLAACCCAVPVATVLAAEPSSAFHPPVRLQAEDGVLDSGEAWGHSGPCLADVDGDGLRDLLVGDFSGQFRCYRNVGSAAQPRYARYEFLKAGGEVAKVPIY